MKLGFTEDIDGSAEQVFAALGDFTAAEAAAKKRGVEVTRQGDPARPEDGLAWDVGFAYRGATRQATIRLVDYEPPRRMVFETVSGGLTIRSVLTVAELTRARSRVTGEIDIAATTLSARLLLQSMKLARGTLESKLRARASDYAGTLEKRIARSA